MMYPQVVMTPTVFQAWSMARYSEIEFCPLFGGRQVHRIEGLQTDEHPVDPRLARLCDEVRNLVAKSVNLDDEFQFQSLALPQLYDPVEDCLPVLVTSEVVVRDEELPHPFEVVEANDALDIICGLIRQLASSIA